MAPLDRLVVRPPVIPSHTHKAELSNFHISVGTSHLAANMEAAIIHMYGNTEHHYHTIAVEVGII